MVWWEYLIVVGVVLLAQLVGGFVFAFWRDHSAKRAAARIRAGRRVPVAVTVVTDRLRRGHAIRDGENVRIHGRAVCFVLDRADVAAATVRRDQIDTEMAEFAQLHGFTDESGRPVFVGPPEEWGPAYRELLRGPAERAGRLRILWSATPRVAVVIGAVAVVVASLFQVIWWTGHDERARVVRVDVDAEGYGDCSVRWDDEGREEGAIVDCYEPFPAVDSVITVRALSWPFEGEAMDDEGSYEGLSVVTAGAALVLLGLGVGTGMKRGFAPPRQLTALRPDAGDPGPGSRGAHGGPGEIGAGISVAAMPDGDGDRETDADTLTLRDLVRRVSRLEGWANEAHPAPAPPAGWQTLRDAARSPSWWFLPPAVALAVLPEDMPDRLRVVIGAVVATVALRTAVRALGVWWTVRGAAHEPVTSKWDYVVVRGLENEWYLFLLLGQTTYWVVVLPEGHHPRVEGRCGVRGQLADGNAIRLVIDGETWVPAGPVMREDEESRRILREDLVERLQGIAAAES